MNCIYCDELLMLSYTICCSTTKEFNSQISNNITNDVKSNHTMTIPVDSYVPGGHIHEHSFPVDEYVCTGHNIVVELQLLQNIRNLL